MYRGTKWSEPPYIIPLLYQQVQEQSSLCDVIIKVGLWEKRFHWCVLVASPFFDAIHRNDFLEKQTGIIELNKWPASLVEVSLLFLYGQKPEVTEANVDTLLDIAGFLMLPDLRKACIDFLKRAQITINNCMHFLELSSVYGMKLRTCESFIRGHLPEVLEQEGMLNATIESVKMLLADPKLSYVPVQNWFNFIIRWVHKDSERQCNFVELFHMLDLGDCDSDFINNIVAKEPLVMNNKELEKTLPTGIDDQNDTVLIFKNRNSKCLTCLNLRKMLWCGIDIKKDNDTEGTGQFWDKAIRGVKNSTNSYIYIAEESLVSNDPFSVIIYDLRNAESSVSNVFVSDTGDNATSRRDFCHSSIANDTLVAMANINRGDVISRGWKGLVNRNRISQSDLHCASTLYIGKLVGPDREMHAILTIKNHTIMLICCGEDGFIAMMSKDKNNLFIFNEPTGELECIRLLLRLEMDNHTNHQLAWFRDGFVLHDRYNVVCISRFSGAYVKPEYIENYLLWEGYDASYKHEYVSGGDRLFRFRFNRYNKDDARLEYVNHDDLIDIEDTALLPWRNIPLPSESRRVYGDCKDVYAVSLPKGTVRCHLDCPHCKLLRRIRSQYTSSDDTNEDDLEYDSDWYLSNGSSDENGYDNN